VPLAVGEKDTLMEQVPFAARLEPQVLVSEKPVVAAMLVMVSALLLALVSVTDCAALLVPTATPVNEMLVGEREALVPVPVKLTVCGLLPALSEMVNVPVTVVADVGVNVTLIVQVPLSAMPVPQVLVSEKVVLLSVKLENVRVAVPELVTVTV